MNEIEQLSLTVPILLDFWSPECVNCKWIEPALNDLAHRFAGQLRVEKARSDENAAGMAYYKVEGLPTLLLFKGGVEVARHVGSASYAVLERFVVDNLALKDVVSIT